MDCRIVERSVDLSSPEIVVKDTYTLLNRGALIYYYTLQVPPDAFNIRAYDSLSILTIFTETNETWGYTLVHLGPKSYVQTDQSWIFTVQYSLPFRDYVAASDNYSLSFSMLSNVSFTARTLSVEITLPEGAEYLGSTPQANSVKKVGTFGQEVDFERSNVTFLDDLGLQVTYKYNTVWEAFRPTLWSSLVVLAVVGTYGTLRLRRKTEGGEVSQSQATLRNFIELYEERLSLSREEEKLDDDLEARRIGRSEYNRHMEECRTKSSGVLAQLKGLKDRIARDMPQYGMLMNETEAAEVEMEVERTNLRELETRLRNRRVSRDAYVRLRDEYIRRMGRARARIERAIVSLREKIY